jgi:hypothetical protein
MNANEERVAQALHRYAQGVVMSSTDLDRMQRTLHRRLGQPPQLWRRPLVAVAAAIVLLAAVLGGVWWLRKAPDPVPVSPQPAGSLTGLWKFTNPLTSSLFVVRSDGTTSEYPDASVLVRHTVDISSRVTDQGQRILVDFTDTQGRACRTEQAVVDRRDGFVAQGVQTLTGPGCDRSTQPESTLTRLSPPAQAARDLPVTTEGPSTSITDPVQLDGVWLVEGTGTVVAMDERTGPAAFVLDDHAYLDPAPKAQGSISIAPDGEVALDDSRCGALRLQRAELRGQAVGQTMTATVAADPCRWFEGRSTVTWVRVL